MAKAVQGEPQRISTLEDLNTLWTSSAPVLLFKHSNRCECSHAVIDEYRSFTQEHAEEKGLQSALVVVQEARSVANEIESRTGVKHQTPQAILMKEGRVLWHASHWGITRKAMESAFEKS
jgi:bacillithiol system protein YtxJ